MFTLVRKSFKANTFNGVVLNSLEIPSHSQLQGILHVHSLRGIEELFFLDDPLRIHGP